MSFPTVGVLQEANPSKSGATLRLKVNDKWYSTKEFHWQSQIGQSLTFEASSSDYGGSTVWWANDIRLTNAGAGAPSQQQGNQPPPLGNPAPPPIPANPIPQNAPQRAPVDRDASIAALALVKCIQGIQSPEQAFLHYETLYHKVLNWNPNETIPY